MSRSSTTSEIDTFMTVVSSTITNCAAPRIRIVVLLRMPPDGPYAERASSGNRTSSALEVKCAADYASRRVASGSTYSRKRTTWPSWIVNTWVKP